MNWDFLDEMNYNLLYTYASKLTRNGYNHLYYAPNYTGSRDKDELLDAEAKRNSAYYLIWFVYRYMLKCETLEEALKYATPDILEKYKLAILFNHNQCKIYIGAYGLNEVYLHNYKNSDIGIVLEILYNRYDYFEQLECFINKADERSKKNRVRCEKAMIQTLELIEDKPFFKDYYEKYKKYRKGNKKR